MRKLEVKLRQLLWAFKETFKPAAGDLVKYKGFKCYIRPTLTGYNTWHLRNIDSESPRFTYVKGSDLKIIRSIPQHIHRFKDLLRFQKQSWGSIDLIKPVGTRLSYNNSDDIQF